MDKLLNDIAPASTTDVAEEKTVDTGTEIAPGAEAAPESDPVTLGGTAVSPGAAFGHAQMFAEGELEIPHFTIEKAQTRAEFTRLRAAVHTVDKEFGELIAELNREEDAPTEAIATESAKRPTTMISAELYRSWSMPERISGTAKASTLGSSGPAVIST